MQSTSDSTVKATLLIFALVGVILLLLSAGVQVPIGDTVTSTFLRELGIVLLTVCGVSVVYEHFIAERHFEKFARTLQNQIERGESNAAMCERLGILRIYSSRAGFETDYPMSQIFGTAKQASEIRIVARSLLLVMIKAGDMARALERGAHVQLCCLNPDHVSPVLKEAGLDRSDIIGALQRFRRAFAGWQQNAALTGSIEIRFHQSDLFDSFMTFSVGDQHLAAWDVSFGADIADKRLILVERAKSLGRDLAERYDSVYENAVAQFHADGKSISKDLLPNAE